MVCRDLGSHSIACAFFAAAVAALATLATEPGVASEVCAPGVAVCGAAPDLARDFSRRRVDRTLATDPAAERLCRLNRNAAPNTGSALVSMTPGGSSTDFNTSLSQWGSALSAADAETLEQAKLSLDKNISLPSPSSRARAHSISGPKDASRASMKTAPRSSARPPPMSARTTAPRATSCSAAWCSSTIRARASSQHLRPPTARPSWPGPTWPIG